MPLELLLRQLLQGHVVGPGAGAQVPAHAVAARAAPGAEHLAQVRKLALEQHERKGGRRD